MSTRLGHLELFADDVEKCRTFYETIGFEHVVSQGPDFVWMKLNEREVLLRRHSSQARELAFGEAGPALVIYTDNVAGTVRALESAGFHKAGCDQGNVRCPLFRDPGGNWVQIVDPEGHH